MIRLIPEHLRQLAPKLEGLPSTVIDRGQDLCLELPFPPSVNHYWRHVGNKVLISAEGRAYRKNVEAIIFGVAKREGRLCVVVEVFQPDERRRDLDNLGKCLLDALKAGGAYNDDSQIDDLRFIRRRKSERPRVEVFIRDGVVQR